MSLLCSLQALLISCINAAIFSLDKWNVGCCRINWMKGLGSCCPLSFLGQGQLFIIRGSFCNLRVIFCNFVIRTKARSWHKIIPSGSKTRHANYALRFTIAVPKWFLKKPKTHCLFIDRKSTRHSTSPIFFFCRIISLTILMQVLFKKLCIYGFLFEELINHVTA